MAITISQIRRWSALAATAAARQRRDRRLRRRRRTTTASTSGGAGARRQQTHRSRRAHGRREAPTLARDGHQESGGPSPFSQIRALTARSGAVTAHAREPERRPSCRTRSKIEGNGVEEEDRDDPARRQSLRHRRTSDRADTSSTVPSEITRQAGHERHADRQPELRGSRGGGAARAPRRRPRAARHRTPRVCGARPCGSKACSIAKGVGAPRSVSRIAGSHGPIWPADRLVWQRQAADVLLDARRRTASGSPRRRRRARRSAPARRGSAPRRSSLASACEYFVLADGNLRVEPACLPLVERREVRDPVGGHAQLPQAAPVSRTHQPPCGSA